jgi:putative tricarboxylic transport membrane protein
MEKSLRRSLEMSQGDFSILFASPISACLLAISALVLTWPAIMYIWQHGLVPPRPQDA